MKSFECACGARVFFENVSCLTCGKELGFIPELQTLSAIEPGSNGAYSAYANPQHFYKKCDNYAVHNACNWLVPAASEGNFCRACQLSRVIPSLSSEENRVKWVRLEAAKRRLVYTIDQLALPLTSKFADAEHGLAFDFKAATGGDIVLTGHEDGIVTLALSEADPVVREKTRVAMREPYRSLLGHFRHESGHYYFNVLLQSEQQLAAFRELFGDERQDYSLALEKHYSSEKGSEVPDDFVSHYATAHPWEDWAETWAHYLHMVDTLETAQSFGVIGRVPAGFDKMLEAWLELTVILNSLNRSMGLADAYPFQIGTGVRRKLAFVHKAIVNPPTQCNSDPTEHARTV